jgi:hypothetical protein
MSTPQQVWRTYIDAWNRQEIEAILAGHAAIRVGGCGYRRQPFLGRSGKPRRRVVDPSDDPRRRGKIG